MILGLNRLILETDYPKYLDLCVYLPQLLNNH